MTDNRCPIFRSLTPFLWNPVASAFLTAEALAEVVRRKILQPKILFVPEQRLFRTGQPGGVRSLYVVDPTTRHAKAHPLQPCR
jgi:hypothetical protein